MVVVIVLHKWKYCGNVVKCLVNEWKYCGNIVKWLVNECKYYGNLVNAKEMCPNLVWVYANVCECV